MPKDDGDIEDPMELTGVALPGDTLEPMAETFVEEFILMGYDDARLLALFRHPGYRAPHMVWRERGEEWVRGLIARVRGVLPLPSGRAESEYVPGTPFEV